MTAALDGPGEGWKDYSKVILLSERDGRRYFGGHPFRFDSMEFNRLIRMGEFAEKDELNLAGPGFVWPVRE